MKILTFIFFTLFSLEVVAAETVKVAEASVIYNRNGKFYNFTILTRHGEPEFMSRYDDKGNPLWRIRVTTKQWMTDKGYSIPVEFKIEEYQGGAWVTLGYPELDTSPDKEAYMKLDNGETDYYELFVTTKVRNGEFTAAEFESRNATAVYGSKAVSKLREVISQNKTMK